MATAANSESQHEVLQPIHPSMVDRLDPVFAKLYNDNVASTPLKPIDLAALRRNYSVLYSYGTAPAPEVARIYDKTIQIEPGIEIDVRVYQPDTTGPWPVHIDFHGGGWGLGDLDTEAHICKHICHRAKVAVIDVAYRLVPETPFPAGITDSFAAVQYIHQHGAEEFNIDPTRISLGGVSAGACIALACAHLARDAGTSIPIQLVAAGTPTVDDISRYTSAADSPFPSMRENEFAPTLNWQRLRFFDALKNKSIPADKTEQVGWFKNLFDAPNFANLPRTVIFTAGADPLRYSQTIVQVYNRLADICDRNEGERYGQILAANGNEVLLKRYPGVPHPFMHMDKELWQAKDFINRTAREIKIALLSD
ncbi:hypothetical protein PRZ48_012689 [Zasmidium cellare]|uniref:Alpha/beta hydrolase fold-3 domain-containing protein n=1 Tax=Zasmidium cellare TaxID=395010 RepID=A0ABR0E651_ZASCE|nr:hypothetical protein PRZ48_012689 [Zasmidium cellare]